MNRLSLVFASCCLSGFLAAQAHASTADAELKRLQGKWRVTGMVDDGRVIPEAQMRQSLPGGGMLEIIDYTILFKSPVDGTKSTKTFRLNPTSYPKEIAIIDKDKITGIGIYQFDKGKLVICVANPSVQTPTDFNAPERSGRTRMVMEPFAPGEEETATLKLPAPPLALKAPPKVAQIQQQAPPPSPVPVPVPGVNQSAPAGRLLTDADVTGMLVGSWRMDDGEGLVDISFDANRTFNTFRHTQVISNFHTVFTPTHASSGTWTVQNGQLSLNVTASWRADRANTTVIFAVRSISGTDAIVVDQLGRVTRAVRR